MAVLLISGILLAAAIPLKNMLSNPYADVDSSPEHLQTIYENRDEIENPGLKYVLARARWLPMKPPPPVTNIRFISLRLDEEINDLWSGKSEYLTYNFYSRFSVTIVLCRRIPPISSSHS